MAIKKVSDKTAHKIKKKKTNSKPATKKAVSKNSGLIGKKAGSKRKIPEKNTIKKLHNPVGRKSTGRVTPVSKNSGRMEQSDPYSHLESDQKENDVMSVGDHLEELRKRIIAILLTIAFCSAGVGIFSPKLHAILLGPFHSITGKNLIMSKAYGGLLVLMKLSVLTGTLISLPVLFYIFWGFITPAVTRKTRIIGNMVVSISSLLFWSGVMVCWMYIFPLSLKFLFVDTLLWGTDPIHPIEEYYGFLFMLHVGSGAAFQLPLVLVILGALGIITMDWHARFWKYILIVIFIIAAILTPPDPISQIFLGTLLCLMYIVSVGIVYLIEKARKRKIAETDF